MRPRSPRRRTRRGPPRRADGGGAAAARRPPLVEAPPARRVTDPARGSPAEALQRRPGSRPSSVINSRASPVRLERGRLPSRPIEREHQLPSDALVLGLCGDETRSARPTTSRCRPSSRSLSTRSSSATSLSSLQPRASSFANGSCRTPPAARPATTPSASSRSAHLGGLRAARLPPSARSGKVHRPRPHVQHVSRRRRP